MSDKSARYSREADGTYVVIFGKETVVKKGLKLGEAAAECRKLNAPAPRTSSGSYSGKDAA